MKMGVLGVALCFLAILSTALNGFAQVYVVCSDRVLIGIDRYGNKIYGNRCSQPTPYDMQQNIPSNCRWFQTLDQAHQWMNQSCDQ
jgi:hypothetical protein